MLRTPRLWHRQAATAPGPASIRGTAWSLRRDPRARGPARQCDYAQSPQAPHRTEGPEGVSPESRAQGPAHDRGAPVQDPCLSPQPPERPETSGTPPPIPAYRGRRVLLIHRPLSSPSSSSAAATTHIRVPALPTLPRVRPPPPGPTNPKRPRMTGTCKSQSEGAGRSGAAR